VSEATAAVPPSAALAVSTPPGLTAVHVGEPISAAPERYPAGPVPAASVRRSMSWFRWVARGVVLAALAGSVVVFRDRLPDLGAMWRVAVHAGPGWLAAVVVAQLASMGMFARVQRRLLRAGGVRMSLPRAIRMTYAGNALSTTLPAGPAMSVAFNFRQYRRAGAPARLATAVVVLGGVIMTGAYAVIGLVALLASPGSRGFALIGLAGMAALLAVIAVAGRRVDLGRLLRPVLTRRLWERVAPALRGGLRLRPADWVVLTVMSLLNWVFDILSLAAAGRAAGLHTALYAITLAYFAAQAAGSLLPILPGGLGAIEGSLAASLVAFGAVAAPAGAAVALYRLVSFWGVVGAGWLAWLAVKAGEQGLTVRR
jgi:uncharacterized membrane protein YbhN (UPF0104 family)